MIVCYTELVSELDRLTAAERAWLIRDEALWRRAYEAAAANPGVDAGGIYRALRNLEKTPSQRLRDSLRHGRLFRSNGR